MTYLVNIKAVSICSTNFSVLMNPNGLMEDRHIVIVSNMLEFPVKGILSANQVFATDHFYDDKPQKLGRKQ